MALALSAPTSQVQPSVFNVSKVNVSNLAFSLGQNMPSNMPGMPRYLPVGWNTCALLLVHQHLLPGVRIDVVRAMSQLQPASAIAHVPEVLAAAWCSTSLL